MQYCAILSQLGEHKKALKTACKCVTLLRANFTLLYDICIDI